MRCACAVHCLPNPDPIGPDAHGIDSSDKNRDPWAKIQGIEMTQKIVLLPGMMCDHRLYAGLIERFSDRYDIQCLDLVGQRSVPDMAQSVLDRVQGRFHLVGLSMGGIVALPVALQAPDRVASLVLLDTNARADRAEVAPLRDAQIETVKHGGLADVLSQQMIPNYFHDRPAHADQESICLTMGLDLGAKAFENQSLALMHRGAVTDHLGDIRCPTLIAMGAHDKLCSLHDHQTMAQGITGSQFHIIPNCGHIPTMETPEAVNQLAETFYAQQDGT